MVGRAGLGLCAAFAIAVPGTAAADDRASDIPAVSFGAGGVAGLEDDPGVAAGLEASVGVRFRPRTSWHARAWWAPLAARRILGGDSGGSADYDVVELRTGPAWWACTHRRCLGISTEAGLQRLHTHEMGVSEDDGTPYDRTDTAYAAVADARFRCLLHPTSPINIEAAFGFRFKARLDDTTSGRTGGGVLFALGVVVGL